ncbi:hypothetical protein PHLGIDRAFT_499485 [Phlebiopsis gigantea 11061_1 CR5-6]|uniref:Uncharacterized protein n=1 Tax=Phlebiopsis gigantea (strain 11061_1 CR5-6) TaxID=745531 RepID=A0A0C3PCS9_PHLG1|nr:hypothetical protein PHLGIDRAFT_499485 [Phlebiopsis gigantea 11061_1 CR5-6]
MQRTAYQGDYNPYTADFSYAPATIPHSGTNLQGATSNDKIASSPRTCPPSKPFFHPLSLAIIAFWIVLIAGEIVLLERSVAVAPTTVKLPWYYSNDGLPSVLFTIFTQGHAPVTAMHLSRLAVSAVQFRGSAPRTWLEMFWLADKKWAGPMGIAMAAWSVVRTPMRVSPTLVVFAATVLAALVTPLVLNRAYPIRAMDVAVNRTFFPNTLAAAKLDQIDAYAQIAVGAGAWSTNLTVLELYNSTTFVPASNPAREASATDFFFAGDVQSMDVTLPGVRIQGGCHAMDNETDVTQDSFIQLCNQELPAIGDREFMSLDPQALNLNVSYCTGGSFSQVIPPSNMTALVWFSNTGIGNEVRGDLVHGVVRCDTNFTTGTAFLSGRSLTYDRFVANDTLYTATEGGEALLDPLYAALWHFQGLKDAADDLESQLYGMLGYTQAADGTGGQAYTSPSLSGFADAMWRGATHMTMALAVLGRESATAYPATAYVPVSARTRDTPFLTGTLVLLGLWAFAMASMTMLVWRPTVLGDSLDSYCAARLAVDRPDLVSGGQVGGISDNRRLLERFAPVAGEYS